MKLNIIKFFSIACVSICVMVYFYNYGYVAGKNKAAKEYKMRLEQDVELAVTEALQKAKELAEYHKKLEEGKEKILLVNKKNRLPSDYEVELITLPDKVNRAAKEAYEPLMDMLAAGRKEGLKFEICSSYRDVKVQERLYIEDVIELMRRGIPYEDAYAEVAKETMPPGHSEHSTGLAFDIVALDYQLLDSGQQYTPESIWLREHCAEYGFILRYPKNKEEITEISFESWHFRYVGIEAAKYIMEQGICLEEYLKNELS